MKSTVAMTRRRHVSSRLAGHSARARLVLALLLVERLTPAETARALGVPTSHVTRIYRLLMARLGRAFDAAVPRRRSGTGARSRPRPAVAARRPSRRRLKAA